MVGDETVSCYSPRSTILLVEKMASSLKLTLELRECGELSLAVRARAPRRADIIMDMAGSWHGLFAAREEQL